ncbi:MAG: guanylate kinase [Candidatus Omnitrophica bacterium]|nr:guanylate kinase [Candidatus Omnitrophota bacterium]
MSKKGKLFVISAPSGSGKTTLCQKLVRSFSGKKRRLIRSVSATTRKARPGERGGRDYFFISRAEFIKKRKARHFLEWASVLGNLYGTPREFVEWHTGCGDDVLLSIDVQGARKIRRTIKGAIFIFITPPSFGELRARLTQRSTEGKREINRRLTLARQELKVTREYHYVVVNDKIKSALRELKQIIRREREK